MPFSVPTPHEFEATQHSTLEAREGLAACREAFQVFPAIRRGDSFLLAYYDADSEGDAECMWEFAEAQPGEPVKMAETLDEMHWGTLGDLYLEASIMAEGSGADLMALFIAVQEIVAGGK